MKLSAIRGATTVESNTKEQIEIESIRLYNQIVLQNHLKPKHIVCIIAGSTTDITAYYPATSLRLSGIISAPLFSTLEPEIENSLSLCIRLLVFARCKSPRHVYLNKAANLLNKG